MNMLFCASDMEKMFSHAQRAPVPMLSFPAPAEDTVVPSLT